MKANASPRKTLARDENAVSPVVATLLLVLVAAGAAIGFGVFLNGFQKNTQSQVQTSNNKETLAIAGSTTVTPMVQASIANFEAAAKTVTVQLSSVGSGSGIRALCSGNADIAMSSKPVGVEASGIPGADQATCPDTNHDGVQDAGKSLQLFPVAIDGIVMITKDTSHCAAGLTLTQAVVRELYRVNGEGSTATGNTASNTPVVGLAAPSASGKYAWQDLLTGCAGAAVASGAPNTGAIVVYQRKDAGGTEDAFCTLIADQTIPSGQSALCSGGELKLAGTTTACDGNPALEACVAADANGLAFMSYGNSKTSSNKIAAYGTTTNVIVPSDGKVKDGARGVSGGYDASRKLWLITAGAPNSVEQQYLDFFVNNASNNKAFANAAGFLGINE